MQHTMTQHAIAKHAIAKYAIAFPLLAISAVTFALVFHDPAFRRETRFRQGPFYWFIFWASLYAFPAVQAILIHLAGLEMLSWDVTLDIVGVAGAIMWAWGFVIFGSGDRKLLRSDYEALYVLAITHQVAAVVFILAECLRKRNQDEAHPPPPPPPSPEISDPFV